MLDWADNRELDPCRRLEFLLASLLTGYPERECFTKAGDIIAELDQAPRWASLGQQMADLTNHNSSLEELASLYIAIFDRGREMASPYESDYGQNQSMSKGHELADIAGFYQAFGLKTNASDVTHEMLDHVSVELEFYAFLLAKQEVLLEKRDRVGCEIVLDARKRFLKDHLGSFVQSIAERPCIVAHPFYSPVYQAVAQLVDDECKQLAITPILVGHFGQPSEPDEMGCGTLGEALVPLLRNGQQV